MEYISYENVSGVELVASPYTMAIGTEIVSTTGAIPELEAKIGLGINKYVDGVLQTYFVQANPVNGNLSSGGEPVSAGGGTSPLTGFWYFSNGGATYDTVVADDTVYLNMSVDNGDYNMVSHAPPGVATPWNNATSRLGWSTWAVGDMIDLRLDLVVITTVANQEVEVGFESDMGTGFVTNYVIGSRRQFKTAGVNLMSIPYSTYIRDDNFKNNPCAYTLWSNEACTALLQGHYVRMSRNTGFVAI